MKRVTLLNYNIFSGVVEVGTWTVVLLTHWDHGTFQRRALGRNTFGLIRVPFLTYLFISVPLKKSVFGTLLPTVSITVQNIYTKWRTEGNCVFYKFNVLLKSGWDFSMTGYIVKVIPLFFFFVHLKSLAVWSWQN